MYIHTRKIWGDLGNSTGSFREKLLSLNPGLPKQVSFIFTPSADLKAGEYTSMIGADNYAHIYIYV
jgi:hypothetical protein